MRFLKKELFEFKLLMRSIPPMILTLFVMSVCAMNLLANKSIDLPFDWLALDCGIVVSWIAFLTMDVITTHFGPKAANEISVLASLLNLGLCFFFLVGSKIPGAWANSYIPGAEALLNDTLDRTFGGTWYVIFGSTVAFISSAFVNNITNFLIGKLILKNPDGFTAYLLRSYVSTAIGQFVDNLVFALIVSHFFFGWSLTQCVTCALTGMIVELLCEVVFSFFGYRMITAWRRDGVGKAYITYRKGTAK